MNVCRAVHFNNYPAALVCVGKTAVDNLPACFAVLILDERKLGVLRRKRGCG